MDYITKCKKDAVSDAFKDLQAVERKIEEYVEDCLLDGAISRMMKDKALMDIIESYTVRLLKIDSMIKSVYKNHRDRVRAANKKDD